MRNYLKFYIDGHWVDPVESRTLPVINPATEDVAGHIAMGCAADVAHAAHAARRSFATWSLTSRHERMGVLQRIIDEYHKRHSDLAAAITEEMGAPSGLSRRAQVAAGIGHLTTALDVLKTYVFEEDRGLTRLVREPIGVCGFITPWNWPINQIVCKVAPAIATGCTIVLKPSELAPFSGFIFSEIMHAAGVPAGVYNMVNGDGPSVGAAISAHPEIDMVSFTGSTRAGIEVAKAAAATVKRVAQELGGKSPNIILPDADLPKAVRSGVMGVMINSGQSCNAPTRMLVPASAMEDVIGIAAAAAERISIGDPDGDVQMGPVVSAAQWTRIQGLIQLGINEGATLIAGGLGRPAGLDRGYFVKPTVFAHVTNDMAIAREEIFGPVLSILGYDSLDEAIAIANATDYGLAAYVSGKDQAVVRQVAARLRAGQVILNSTPGDRMAPFGGYKMSGNGRECGDIGFAEFLETKAMLGYTQPQAAA